MSVLRDDMAPLRLVVCAGAGGVGRTTVAAVLALGLAEEGRRVALVTIDPSRRLAEALPVDECGNAPEPVDPARFIGAGLEIRGQLSAVALSVKPTLDELIIRLAPDRRTGQQILDNPVYRQLSSAVAGGQDYAAMSKLLELHRDSRYDVIVLDTPPARRLLDFLVAPQRLAAFLDTRALSIFLRSSGAMFRLAALASGALRRIVGLGMVDDLTTFFGLLSGLTAGFRDQAAGTQALLADDSTGFLLITSPESAPSEEAIFLGRALERLGMHRSAIVVNRAHPIDPAGTDVDTVAARLSSPLGDALAVRVARWHAELQILAWREQPTLSLLDTELDETPTYRVLDRGRNVPDVTELVSLCTELFSAPSMAFRS